MPSYTIREIADALSARFVGQGDLVIDSVQEPALAGPRQLAVAMSPDYGEVLADGAATAAILWPGADWQGYGLQAAIFVERPRLAMADLTGFLHVAAGPATGIHATAIIDPSTTILHGAAIGPYVVISADCTIGENCRIMPHTYIGPRVKIGADCTLQSGVKIGADVTIGDRLLAHPGVTIGADGFSFVTAEKSHVETVRETLGDTTAEKSAAENPDQPWLKIHSLGGVEIGNDVEIGASTNIDAGTIRATKVGSGTKIDALVQLGHNVQVGSNCLLCGQVGIAGSTIIGNSVVMAGQVGIADNITVGNGVVIGGGSKVMSSIPAGRAMLGFPAVKMDTHIEIYKALRRLPKFMRSLKAAEKPVSKDPGND